jgi:transcription-repair coupling factor (superfamily II helicase)
MRDLDIRGAGDLLGAEQSGFISDIGFEMYQKILDEAISELKEEEFKELYADEKNEDSFIEDCQLDTDMEILIPNIYVNSISERLKLYNELGSFETEEELVEFEAKLSDRFGQIPVEANELIKSVKLRWLAKKIGFQRLSLKNTNMTGYFPPQDSPYFQSPTFGKILDYLKHNHRHCEMKELKGKLIFRLRNIESIQEAIDSCQKLIS